MVVSFRFFTSLRLGVHCLLVLLLQKCCVKFKFSSVYIFYQYCICQVTTNNKTLSVCIMLFAYILAMLCFFNIAQSLDTMDEYENEYHRLNETIHYFLRLVSEPNVPAISAIANSDVVNLYNEHMDVIRGYAVNAEQANAWISLVQSTLWVRWAEEIYNYINLRINYYNFFYLEHNGHSDSRLLGLQQMIRNTPEIVRRNHPQASISDMVNIFCGLFPSVSIRASSYLPYIEMKLNSVKDIRYIDTTNPIVLPANPCGVQINPAPSNNAQNVTTSASIRKDEATPSCSNADPSCSRSSNNHPTALKDEATPSCSNADPSCSRSSNNHPTALKDEATPSCSNADPSCSRSSNDHPTALYRYPIPFSPIRNYQNELLLLKRAMERVIRFLNSTLHEDDDLEELYYHVDENLSRQLIDFVDDVVESYIEDEGADVNAGIFHHTAHRYVHGLLAKVFEDFVQMEVCHIISLKGFQTIDEPIRLLPIVEMALLSHPVSEQLSNFEFEFPALSQFRIIHENLHVGYRFGSDLREQGNIFIQFYCFLNDLEIQWRVNPPTPVLYTTPQQRLPETETETEMNYDTDKDRSRHI